MAFVEMPIPNGAVADKCWVDMARGISVLYQITDEVNGKGECGHVSICVANRRPFSEEIEEAIILSRAVGETRKKWMVYPFENDFGGKLGGYHILFKDQA